MGPWNSLKLGCAVPFFHEVMPAPPSVASRLRRSLGVVLFNAFCVAGVVSLFLPRDDDDAVAPRTAATEPPADLEGARLALGDPYWRSLRIGKSLQPP